MLQRDVWLAAAKAHDAARDARIQRDLQNEKRTPTEAAIQAAAAELNAFLESEDGAAARELLSAAHMSICLGITGVKGDEQGVRHGLDGSGLKRQEMGSKRLLIPGPKEPIDAITVVRAYVADGTFESWGIRERDPAHLMPWLIAWLNCIATMATTRTT